MNEYNFSVVMIVFWWMKPVQQVVLFGGTASNQNKLVGVPDQNGLDVGAVNGLADSDSAARETGILCCFLVYVFVRIIN